MWWGRAAAVRADVATGVGWTIFWVEEGRRCWMWMPELVWRNFE